MKTTTYLVISGAVFGLVAVGQAIRFFRQLPVQIGTWDVPLWISGIAAVFAAAMCLWALSLARRGLGDGPGA